MSRRAQLRLWLLALDRFELRLRGKIAQQRSRFIRESSKQYEANNGQIPGWVKSQHAQGIRNILADHYQAVIPHFGRVTLSKVKSRRIERKAADDLFTSFMQEWVTTEALLKANMISATDYNAILKAIQAGLDAGEGIAAIAKKIKDVSASTPYHAATIARTETHNAATFGSVESARVAEQEFGVQMNKVWLSTLDNRTRPGHRNANNQTVGLGEKFQIGTDNMDRPGDPSAEPDNVINCRCAVAFEEKE